ncbi:cytochrome c biogenesis protein CcsA [Tenacibaculum sp. ZS6-P6]|uniref:cytochrome c biogenesis protein n=1 Tax=Tenacibaculum sp. ZS6-P6 TaxID=3447503 RepID=UPI003F992C9A
MKKILNILYSTRLMAVLFFVFAAAMGIATFIENDFGTQTAKKLVYNTWWFEVIMLFFIINFFGNIFRYKLLRKEKWTVFMFHIAFLFIIIGAGITRYIGYEGMMIIDEGESTNIFLSDVNYLNATIDDNTSQKTYDEKLLLSAWGKNSKDFTFKFQPDKSKPANEVNFKLVDYIPWSEKKLVLDENGVEHLFFVESSSGSRHEHYIKRGTIQNIHNILVGFDAPNKNANINFFYEGDNLKILSKADGNWLRMADQKRGQIVKDSVQNFQFLTLNTIEGLQFVVPRPAEKGEMKIIRGKKDDKKFDTVVFDISCNGETQQVEFTGGQFNTSNKKDLTIGGLNIRAWYGAKLLQTPFKVKLNDFQLEKYPGSESASSFASEVTVIDNEDTFDYRIYMNHILDYRGYKFFQASYRNEGEAIEQTHLSVNHDFWGTFVTYLGYSLLYIGLISMLFSKHTRFDSLKKQLKKVQEKRTIVLFPILFSFGLTFGQHETHKNLLSEEKIDSLLQVNIVDGKHADEFSKLVIQDAGGRMKPAHTFASELVRKVSHAENFKGMTPSQILLSMTEYPRFWFQVPFIYLEKGNYKIREVLGLPKSATHARFIDFYDTKGNSKINKLIDQAQKKKIQNKFEQDVIKIEKRLWLLNQAIGGGILKIYPIPNDENNKWVSQPETFQVPFKGTDSVFVKQSLPVYLQLLQEAKQSKNYEEAGKVLDGIKKFQKKYGSEVLPSERKINTEILYNKAKIFPKLAKYYGLVSVLLILFVILQIFYTKKIFKLISKILIYSIIGLFLIQTSGLIIRWYISGHAPWSNAYESVIYVAWATMLFGLTLGRKSSLTIGAATFVSAIILAFANQYWIDPEIANLQPVLNSWWVLVHVSIIVASYGPFSLSMILGVLALILLIFKNNKNYKKIDQNVKEVTIINEMSLTVGVVMLTVGNFLGGMWANESWGRYWGWDPKETWALISIMVCAFVLHMRLIPGLRGKIAFNFMSALSYLSIMMTFFGVNFYLSGLHSYASGDRVVTPKEAYIYTFVLIFITIIAWLRNKKFSKK